jgi:DNA modification methylase
MNTYTLHQGNCIDVLPTLRAASVQCVVTSPPYYGLRDYGTAAWLGGDPDCDHVQRNMITAGMDGSSQNSQREGRTPPPDILYKNTCGKCGAQREDGQIGLEESPAAYVANLVAVFRGLRHVLRDDGVIWLNLGDSYASDGARQTGRNDNGTTQQARDRGSDGYVVQRTRMPTTDAAKPKDLLGIPWRVAFALQDDGWYLRCDVIWSKPNPMPESVTDRPTRAHEYIFLLTKNARYFYDAQAIAEPATATALGATGIPFGGIKQAGSNGNATYSGNEYTSTGTRNARSVWTIATQPRPEAHFAAFPDDLARRCILAGTSAHGCCSACGAPWVRVIDSQRIARNELPKDDPRYRPHSYNGAYGDINGKADAGYREVTHLGWEPSCACGCDVRPCTVLDPFAGRGTVLAMAISNGRDAVGIELNPEYARLIDRNLARTQPALLVA